MAKLSADKKSVTVEKGDTLGQIAVDYAGGYSKYKQLAAINNISNPNLIYIGQKIKLTNEGGSSSGSSSTKTANSNKPDITAFGLLSNKDNTLFATWTWSKSKDHTAKYKVSWTYITVDGVWFDGTTTEISVDKDAEELSRQSTYGVPDGATQVKFKVKPISETKTKNNVETNYWDADWSAVKTWTNKTPLGTPSTPSVEIEKLKLTATLDNIDIAGATHIEFQVVKNDSDVFATKQAEIVTGHASYAFNINAGGRYKVRCRSYSSKTKGYSDWSQYSSNSGTIPNTPDSDSLQLKAVDKSDGKISVQISWTAVENAAGYVIEYTTKKIYFDASSEVTSLTVKADCTSYIITNMTGGKEYFFRLKAKGESENEDSGWTEIKSLVIGEPPAAPTTWSSTTTAVTGNPVTIYWVHNAEDGSTQTFADLELYINNSEIASYTKTLTNDKSVNDDILTYTPLTEEEREDGVINSAIIKTTSSTFNEGSKIEWRIRTAGATKELGEWSIKRIITVNASPTLQLNVTDSEGNEIDTLTSFPFYIKGVAGPETQAPIGYHLSIKSNEVYETVDRIGNPKVVNVDEEVYSKYFDISTSLLVELSAGHIDLENNIEYTVTCVASMDSGLTVEESRKFSVSWVDKQYIPNAAIGIDEDTISANIRPYCKDAKLVYYKVIPESVEYEKTSTQLTFAFGELIPDITTTTGEPVYDGMTTDGEIVYFCIIEGDEPTYYKVDLKPGKCTKTATALDSTWGETIKGVKTTTGEQVYSGVTADGDAVYYCVIEESTPVTDVLLSVYRREFDGSFTELATGLDSAKNTTITDPHPALDYARYRIVATSETTGAVSYYDPPGYPVEYKAVVIQWDEQWTNFETSEEAVMEQPTWSGSMLKLPYNIDVSDSNSPDMSLIEYAGRSHPVTYYGTQLGSTATWSLVIPKNDKETLYALRRLARWLGDVYVREPSGSGYWANVKVSFSQKHTDMTIPITLSITQVEGGI